jgi:hypothetical protein
VLLFELGTATTSADQAQTVFDDWGPDAFGLKKLYEGDSPVVEYAYHRSNEQKVLGTYRC